MLCPPGHRFDPVRALGIMAEGAIVLGFWFGLACFIYQCST